MIICICEGITDREIRKLIDAGINTPEDIGFECLAGTGCEACCEDIRLLIEASNMNVEDPHLTRVRLIASSIQYRDWMLRVERDNANEGGRVFIQWVYNDPCVLTGETQEWHCRKWYLSPHMLESEVVKTAFAAALAAEEHECRERFRYKDVRLFNPHISLDAMMDMARRETTRANPIDEDM